MEQQAPQARPGGGTSDVTVMVVLFIEKVYFQIIKEIEIKMARLRMKSKNGKISLMNMN